MTLLRASRSKYGDSEYIRFVEGPPKPKTKTWYVVAVSNAVTIGTVAWYGGWRQYAFFPAASTVFEQRCLRDIAVFCEEQTKDHKAGSRKKVELP